MRCQKRIGVAAMIFVDTCQRNYQFLNPAASV